MGRRGQTVGGAVCRKIAMSCMRVVYGAITRLARKKEIFNMTAKRARIKFLNPDDIEETISEIAAIAIRNRIDTVLVGDVAMSVYGSDRLTRDVDVACRDEYLPELKQLKKLSFGGFSTKSPAGHPVDVIVRNDAYRPLYVAAIEDARDEGLPLPVVGPEYLAALKMAAARDKDKLDLETLFRLGTLDIGKTHSIIKQHLGEYAAREWDSLIAEFEWKLSREKENKPHG